MQNEIKLPKSLSYIGSKMKLLDWIKGSIETYTNKKINEIKSFVDLFSGTGVVGYYMMQKGIKNVTSNDIQHYSYIVSSVWTQRDINIDKIKKLIEEFNEMEVNAESFENLEIDTSNFFIYNTYSQASIPPRMYFTKDNALKIDIIRQEIEKSKSELSIQEYNLLIKILLYASTKVGNISSTWGAYLKTFKKTALDKIVLDTSMLDLLLERNNINHTVYNKDIIHLLNENDFNSTDIVYLDSPYNNRQYSSNYFVLEAISKYNSPEIKNGITGLLKETNEGSKIFCSKVNAKRSFETILSKIKSKFIFISYSSDSIVSKDDMIKILELNWTNIICYIKEYKRFKSNNNGVQEATIQEYLFAATRNF